MAHIPILSRLLLLSRPRAHRQTLCKIYRRLHLRIFNTRSSKNLVPVTSYSRLGPTCQESMVRLYCEQREAARVEEENIHGVSEEELQHIARQIRDKASEIDKMALSVPLRMVLQSVRTLIQNGFSVSECLDLACNPVIIKHFSNFTTIYSTYTQYGYKPETVTQIFRKVPELITLNEQQFIAQYEALRLLGFTDGPLETIVTQSPDILLTDPAKVQATFTLLKTNFSSPDVVKVFEQYPAVYKDDLKDVEAKLVFAKDNMDATNRQMLSSMFFQHSLAHIETRHMFVLRAGFWRVARKRDIHFENPLLRDILDTTDEEFAKMFGNMTLQDYEVFKTLFEKEKEHVIESINPAFEVDDD